MDGGEFTALYTLQHGLSGYAEKLGRLKHRHIAFAGLFNEARTKLLCDADAPWRPWGDLFTGNEAIGKPSMKVEGARPSISSGLLDSDQFAFLGVR